MTLYERYLNGEREDAWSQLSLLGPRVYQSPCLDDARAVAHETMTRARANVELLVDRLANMGFDFLLPRTAGSAWMGPTGPEISTDDLLVHCLPRPDADALMAVIQETTAGVVPLSVRAWYQIVGDVSLLGDHPLLSSYKLPMLDGRVMYSDPLMIVPLRSLVNELEFFPEVSTKFSFFPDKYFKAGRGGAMPIEIHCEGAQADEILHNEPHGLSFVQYLRRSFAWGGFPGWSEYPNRPQRELRYLADGLLPI